MSTTNFYSSTTPSEIRSSELEYDREEILRELPQTD